MFGIIVALVAPTCHRHACFNKDYSLHCINLAAQIYSNKLKYFIVTLNAAIVIIITPIKLP